MDHGNGQTHGLYESKEEIPSAPETTNFRVSCLTIVVYVFHRLTAGSLVEDTIETGLAVDSGEFSYLNKLNEGSELLYGSPFTVSAPRFPRSHQALLDGQEPCQIQQSLVWWGGDYLLSVIPHVFAVEESEGMKALRDTLCEEMPALIRMSRPLELSELLSLLGDIDSEDYLSDLALQSSASTADRLGIDRKSVESCTVPGSIGIQLWDLSGTREFDSKRKYMGLDDSKKYGWELSALLSSESDHFKDDLSESEAEDGSQSRNPGAAWTQRSRDQVFDTLVGGMSFFDDHMVFVNSTRCLEVTHLPGWLRKRSADRLRHYGYDSSSLFVWTLCALRWQILLQMGREYREKVKKLQGGDSAQNSIEYSAESRLRDLDLVENLDDLRFWLRESRNQDLERTIASLRDEKLAFGRLMRDLEKAELRETEVLRVQSQAQESRQNRALTVVAIALAVTGIPAVVAQFVTWLKEGSWVQMSIALVLAILVSLALWAIVRGVSFPTWPRFSSFRSLVDSRGPDQ